MHTTQSAVDVQHVADVAVFNYTLLLFHSGRDFCVDLSADTLIVVSRFFVNFGTLCSGTRMFEKKSLLFSSFCVTVWKL